MTVFDAFLINLLKTIMRDVAERPGLNPYWLGPRRLSTFICYRFGISFLFKSPKRSKHFLILYSLVFPLIIIPFSVDFPLLIVFVSLKKS